MTNAEMIQRVHTVCEENAKTQGCNPEPFIRQIARRLEAADAALGKARDLVEGARNQEGGLSRTVKQTHINELDELLRLAKK